VIYETLLVAGGERFHPFCGNVYGGVGVCGTNVGRGTFLFFPYHFISLAWPFSSISDWPSLILCMIKYSSNWRCGRLWIRLRDFCPCHCSEFDFLIDFGIPLLLPACANNREQLYFWTFSLASPKYRNVLCWCVGYANTVGSVAAVASIDWGCAVQVMAAANIGTGFEATSSQLFGVYAAIVITHAVICCLGTQVLARLQTVYVLLNVLLCLAIIIALPAATPAEFKNSAKVALWDFYNGN
jgi:amino acid transporter